MGETPGTQIAGMRCGLFRSGMDAACSSVRMDMNGKDHDMHSGGTLFPTIERNVSEGDLGVKFVFQ